MILGINALSARIGGGLTYIESIVPELARLRLGPIVVFANRCSSRVFPDETGIRVVFLPTSGGLLSRVLCEQLLLPLWCMRLRVEVLFCVTETAPFFAFLPTVIMMRNLQLVAGQNSGYRMRILRSLAKMSARKAAAVVCVSEHAARLGQCVLGFESSKIHVVRHGVGEHFVRVHSQGSETEEGRTPYLLVVSSLYRHKRIDTLLTAMAMLIDNDEFTGELVVAGRLVDPDYSRELERQSADLGLEGRVKFVGEVPNQLLPNLYSGCSVFVFPSTLESFGHPVVEAMAAGAPVCATDIPAVREIAGAAAEYFPPDDAAALAKTLGRLLASAQLRNDLRARGSAQAAQLTWHQCARSTAEILDRAREKR